MPPPGWTCGLPRLNCDETRSLVVRVSERGEALEAYVPDNRSSEVDRCILSEVRRYMEFIPAHECNGNPLPESTVMTERTDEYAKAALRSVVRDPEAQQRRSGWLLTTALLVVVVLFRWLSEGPYAGNSIHFALVLVVIGIRAADHQLARGVARLAKLFPGDDIPRVG